MKQLNARQAGSIGPHTLLAQLLAGAGPAAGHPLQSMHTDPIAPVILGVTGILFFAILGRFAAACVLMPDLSLNTDLFIAATLGATSVGITARVLQDLRREQSSEAHIIPGAAVMDDLLGLLMLSIVSGIIVSWKVELLNIVVIIVLAVLFIGGVLFLGP